MSIRTEPKEIEDIVCANCTEMKILVDFPCHVCQRKMAYYKCEVCENAAGIIDICSPKCQQILNGEAHIVPIQYNHQTVMVIEDFDDIIGLKVVNHYLLNQILTHQQKAMLKSKCNNCKENTHSLLPYKCWSCKDVYTYEVECDKCYNKNGYLCDECDFEING